MRWAIAITNGLLSLLVVLSFSIHARILDILDELRDHHDWLSRSYPEDKSH